MVEAIAGYMSEIGVTLNIFSTEYPVARTKRMTGNIPGHISCLGTDYATMPIAEASVPFVANAKKITSWDLGRTLYDNNDRGLIRPDKP